MAGLVSVGPLNVKMLTNEIRPLKCYKIGTELLVWFSTHAVLYLVSSGVKIPFHCFPFAFLSGVCNLLAFVPGSLQPKVGSYWYQIKSHCYVRNLLSDIFIDNNHVQNRQIENFDTLSKFYNVLGDIIIC